MEISAALAADLAILTDALDEPGVDVAAMLRQLASDAKAAVDSYLGMSVAAGHSDTALNLTMMEELAATVQVRASLMISLPAPDPESTEPAVAVVLYAANPGAFVDLAADLSRLTGLRLDEVALDRHLRPVDGHADGIGVSVSVINQALGVLIGRGHTPEQANGELDDRAAAAGSSRDDAARAILRAVTPPQ